MMTFGPILANFAGVGSNNGKFRGSWGTPQLNTNRFYHGTTCWGFWKQSRTNITQ